MKGLQPKLEAFLLCVANACEGRLHLAILVIAFMLIIAQTRALLTLRVNA
jgi:hypothetical protein